ncbi:MAG: DUF1015 family protein [Puia sp.]
MAIISAFRSLRPSKELAPRVASLPYDVLNSAEARVVADHNPYSLSPYYKSRNRSSGGHGYS